jgi:hypothetical protein
VTFKAYLVSNSFSTTATLFREGTGLNLCRIKRILRPPKSSSQESLTGIACLKVICITSLALLRLIRSLRKPAIHAYNTPMILNTDRFHSFLAFNRYIYFHNKLSILNKRQLRLNCKQIQRTKSRRIKE